MNYCKVCVSVSVGNRKSQVIDPVEVEEKVNFFDGELNTILLNVVDAIKALPTVGGNYTRDNIIDSMCATFELQRVPAGT